MSQKEVIGNTQEADRGQSLEEMPTNTTSYHFIALHIAMGGI